MKNKALFLALLLCLPFTTLASHAKRKGLVRVKSIFKADQSVQTATYTEDTENNTASLTLGGRKRFTSASIILSFNDLLDQIVKGAEFTTANTGKNTDLDGTVKINLLAAKFKTGGGFEYTTFNDDESTVRNVLIKVLKISKKGIIKLKVKATFDNVRLAQLDENGAESSVGRADGIKAVGIIKYDPSL